MFALLLHHPGAAPERRDLSGPLRAGGSRADDLRLPDCPPAALRLLPCAAGVVVEAIACGVHVGGHPVHPGERRLLRPGERAELRGSAFALEPRAASAEGTRAAAAALLHSAAAGEGPVTGAHLVVLGGPAAGTRFPLGPEQTLGRGRAATIQLPDPAASRVHVRLRLLASGAVQIEDLGSKNGVRVNGVRIDRRPLALRPGDEVVVGETALAVEDGLRDAPGPQPEPEPGEPAAPSTRRRRRPPPHLLAAALLALSAAALALAAG